MQTTPQLIKQRTLEMQARLELTHRKNTIPTLKQKIQAYILQLTH